MHGGITREHDCFLSPLVDTTDHLTPLVDTTAHCIQTIQDMHIMMVCGCWTRTHHRVHVANDPLEGHFLVVPIRHFEQCSLYIVYTRTATRYSLPVHRDITAKLVFFLQRYYTVRYCMCSFLYTLSLGMHAHGYIPLNQREAAMPYQVLRNNLIKKSTFTYIPSLSNR